MRQVLLLLPLLILAYTTAPLQAQTTADGESEAMQGFARSVEILDGKVLIGEPANYHQPGIVYEFSKNGSAWEQSAMLSASDGEIGNSFGASFSADGNMMLIGAPGTNDNRGAAYMFEMNSNGEWTETAQLSLADTAQTGFGNSVLVNGDHAFVSAPGHDDGAGAVIVYRRSNGEWSETVTLANPDSSGSNFGSTLALDGNHLAVGAPQRQGGNVFVFENDGSDWNHTATLDSRQADERSFFGSSLKVRENQIFAGAPRHDSGSGAVIVFTKDEESGEWEESSRLVAFDSQSRYAFGSAIEFSGESVWIGAPNSDSGAGAIYRFTKDENGNWSSSSKMRSDRGEGEQFAGTLAVDGNLAVVGLTGTDFGAGSAAIMERDDSGMWVTQEILVGEGDDVLQPITGNRVNCSDGMADLYLCENVDLISFLPISAIGGDRGVRLNDMWGWTDPETDKNYAIVGRNEGTSFVDVTDPLNPVYIGNLPLTDGAQPSSWRDMKVYKNHVYVVSDNAREHGMQVLDLTQLRDFDGEPILFEETTIYDNVNSVHNIVINEETGYAFAVGSGGGGETCGGGLHMIDIRDPANPTFAGCFADPSTGRSGTGYIHDAQCVTYTGPDEEHQGQEVCFGANETAISIADVTDKENPVALSTASYPDHAYVHQGWLTEDQRYFFQNDELDELTGIVDRTRTIIWDVSDLDDPQFVREFYLDNPASDHNLYILGNTMYQSNYVSGLQVIDISNPEEPEHVGYFDTHPFVENAAGFSGTWSNFPYFDDIVLMTSSNEGLFILDANRD
ncbi:choice-of-anchor B family protein [Rhodohalobacter sp.]|uniref:choice-of-anchor B family protein n=1 Tax=Rhodohalobacter sp. TaxID=1974210 RepID=UPI002ACD5179|nr:choice-of-anchor B family protein [Rhodohalobacter sp.]MDZ7756536.1 choice-of-anchor B family protein [Rhodohalobacter sp.]